MIASLRPKSYQKYLTLPIFGSILDEFITWSLDRGYTTGTMKGKLKDVRRIDAYFRGAGAQRLEDLSQRSFESGWRHYCHLHPNMAGTIRLMEYFLREIGRLDPLSTQLKMRTI